MDDQTIPWWQSRTIIGSLVTVIVSIAAGIGYTIDLDKLADMAFTLATLLGGLWTLYGRIQATQIVSKTQVAPGITLTESPKVPLDKGEDD